MLDVLAWDEVMERLDGDQDLFHEIVEMFFQSYDSEITKIESAIASCDAVELSSYAHGFKSAFGNLGAMQCFALANKLEEIDTDKIMSDAPVLLNELKIAVDAFKLACSQVGQ